MKHVTILLSLLVASCYGGDEGKLLKHTEVVLTPGMTITATNPNGTVTIHASDVATRDFSGKGWKKSSKLIPRRTRWYGSLGLYDPATSASPYGRLLADEGKLFFGDESEFLKYLYSGSTYYKPVFTNSGLVFGYHVDNILGGEATRSIQLWQVYIKGEKPKRLKGADDSAITVKGGATPAKASPNPAPVGYKKKLGDVEYKPTKQ